MGAGPNIAVRLEFQSCPAYLRPVNPQPKAEATMANPLQFLQQVRSEVAKVVWPTRREVMLTTVMVFIMAALTAVFFFLVDMIIQTGLHAILGIAG
jgi:preprotein translocase subunit SecE